MEPAPAETADVVRQIKQMLANDLQLGVIPDQIPDDYSLLDSGLALDSILIAELVAQIEDRFGLEIDNRVLRAELFDNLSVLGAFVARERLAKSHAGAARSGVPPC